MDILAHQQGVLSMAGSHPAAALQKEEEERGKQSPVFSVAPNQILAGSF